MTISKSASVEAVYVVVVRGEAPEERTSVQLLAGQGIEGERRCKPGNPVADHVTLVEAEAVEQALALLKDDDAAKGCTARDTRRNLVTRGVALNHLVGQRFRLGDDVVLQGIELCDPCARLARLTSKGFERALTHRGGLRCEVVVGGTVAVGSAIRAAIQPAIQPAIQNGGAQ